MSVEFKYEEINLHATGIYTMTFKASLVKTYSLTKHVSHLKAFSKSLPCLQQALVNFRSLWNNILTKRQH